MKTLRIKLLGLALVLALWTGAGAGCAPSAHEPLDEPSLDPGSVAQAAAEDAPTRELTGYPSATFYRVTHGDPRDCAWPACGGSFTQRVNTTSTVCADGSVQAECRVIEFDYSALKLDRTAQDKLRIYVENGQALLRGTLTKTAPIAGRTYDKLVVSEAWIARALSAPRGSFARTRSLPLAACAGCPTYPYELLNLSVAPQRLHSVVFDPTRFSAALRTELEATLASHDEGILTAGVRSSSGGRELVTVSEAYTPFPGYKPRLGKVGESCGTRGTPTDCEAGLFCQRSPDGSCGRTDAAGVCTVKPAVCPLIFRPICGCDGKTYGNRCEAQTQGASVDYEGSCRRTP